MGDIKLFITALLTNSLVFTTEFGEASSRVIKDTWSASAFLNRRHNHRICAYTGKLELWWLVLNQNFFGVWFSSEVLDILFSHLSSSPSVFLTKHPKHSEDCATAVFFYGKKRRCKMNTQGCDMNSWGGAWMPISQTLLGQCQWSSEGARTGVTAPALPCWDLLWEEHSEKKLQHKIMLMLYVKYVEKNTGMQWIANFFDYAKIARPFQLLCKSCYVFSFYCFFKAYNYGPKYTKLRKTMNELEHWSSTVHTVWGLFARPL